MNRPRHRGILAARAGAKVRAPVRRVGAVTAIAIAITFAAVGSACGTDTPSRQDAVAERGADVMPFDLDATTHRFDPNGTGLVETVVADDPSDAEQVRLVQEHLREEASRFQDGDYADPARIHGDDMPGLAELEAGAGGVTVSYAPLDDGATITFTTSDPALVDALRRWGEAQTSDHGTHAEHPTSSALDM